MLVLGVNKVLNWCQVLSGGRRYTCCTDMVNGELCFYFKKAYHSVAQFATEHTHELVREGEKVLLRSYRP